MHEIIEPNICIHIHRMLHFIFQYINIQLKLYGTPFQIDFQQLFHLQIQKLFKVKLIQFMTAALRMQITYTYSRSYLCVYCTLRTHLMHDVHIVFVFVSLSCIMLKCSSVYVCIKYACFVPSIKFAKSKRQMFILCEKLRFCCDRFARLQRPSEHTRFAWHFSSTLAQGLCELKRLANGRLN